MIGGGAIRPMLHQRSTRGCPGADPLPDIVGRLARLEEADFSYDDLLLDFASRRHLNPVKGSPVVGRGATDPAQEADEIVQVGNKISSPAKTFHLLGHIHVLMYLRVFSRINIPG